MNKYKTLRNIIIIISFAILISGSVLLLLKFGLGAFIISLCLSALIILLMLILCVVNNREQEKLISDLSDLMTAVSSAQFKAVFPENDDSLLSKLQNQLLRITETLRMQNAAVENEKNDIKALISDISHQLKTPVANLKMYGEFMLDETSSESERSRYFDTFSASLDKLVFLTDSMIMMSRLESGIIALNKEPCDLGETILTAVMQAYDKAIVKNTEIMFNPELCKIRLSHDRRWTSEAIYNIIDNAVKYGDTGGKIIITLKRYEMYARLDISDTGNTISESEQSKIFARFYRGSNALSEEGVGIGLYLSRKIISDQGGYVKVHSADGQTVFSVFLLLD